MQHGLLPEEELVAARRSEDEANASCAAAPRRT